MGSFIMACYIGCSSSNVLPIAVTGLLFQKLNFNVGSSQVSLVFYNFSLNVSLCSPSAPPMLPPPYSFFYQYIHLYPFLQISYYSCTCALEALICKRSCVLSSSFFLSIPMSFGVTTVKFNSSYSKNILACCGEYFFHSLPLFPRPYSRLS